MKERSHGVRQKRVRRENLVIIGVAVNVILSYLMAKSGIPLFLDTMGTIGVTVVGGVFPGIVCAVITNIICMFFNGDAIYFVAVNVLIALATAWFARKYPLKTVVRAALLALLLSAVSGILSGLIQWGLIQDAQYAVVGQNARSLAAAVNIPYVLAFFLTNTVVNILDKGISVFVVYLVTKYLIPEEKLKRLQGLSWKQRAMERDEVEALKSWSRDVGHPMQARLTRMLVSSALIIVFVTAFISARLYYESEKREKAEIAEKAAQLSADFIDISMLDEYIEKGEAAPGYRETKNRLERIRSSLSDVTYLYVFVVRDEGFQFVFDLDTEDLPAYEVGQIVEVEEELIPYLDKLKEGEALEPIETSDLFGWLQTIYYPVKNEAGKTVCYVGADVSLDYMANYIKDFLMKVILILSGFFILIIYYSIWSTERYITYPISSMAVSVDHFSKAGEDQEVLDANVKEIRALDIHTGDEVEKLYQAICRMTLYQAEQMRSLRRLSESTAKMQDGLIVTMADMVEGRDTDTGAHVQKTAAYVKIIVEGLKRKGYYAEKLTPKFISDVERSAPLHDVGKIHVSDKILNKPGPLTEDEFEDMKTHTTMGKKIMENAISTVQGENYLKEARNMAAYHHERWDGAGYPEGLHGEVIPLSARIMAVADVFDALTSPRVYKPAYPLDEALAIIEEGSGTQFDPKCVEAFMDSLAEVKVVLKKYNQV